MEFLDTLFFRESLGLWVDESQSLGRMIFVLIHHSWDNIHWRRGFQKDRVDDQQELGDQLSKVRDIELTKAIIGVAESRCKIGCRSLSAGIEQPTTWTFRLFGFSHKDCHASDDLVCIYSTEIVCPVPKYYMDRIKRWYSVGICIQHLSLSLTLSLSLSLSLSGYNIYIYDICNILYVYISYIVYIYISYIVYIYHISYILHYNIYIIIYIYNYIYNYIYTYILYNIHNNTLYI